MHSDEMTDGPVALAHWGEPIVLDRLCDAYATRLGRSSGFAQVLIGAHARFWRALLALREHQLPLHRREVVALVRLAGHATTLVDVIDAEVLDELGTGLLVRALRTPHGAREDEACMLRMAAHLGRMHMMRL